MIPLTEKATSLHTDKSELITGLSETEMDKLLWTKENLVKTISYVDKRVCARTLQRLLKRYAKETKRHIKLINKLSRTSNRKTHYELCYFSNILLREIRKIAEREADRPFVKDILVIQSLQKILNFQITSLNSLSAVARNTGAAHFSKLLEAVREEEREFAALFCEILVQDLHKKLYS